MKLAPIQKIDGYKPGHFIQYRPGMQYISSYIEARGCDRPWKDMVFAGIQAYLMEYMSQPFVTKKSLNRLRKRLTKYGVSFDYDGWEYILNTYDGYLPLHIQALPEGLVVPFGTPLVQVVNTDPKCAAI